MTEMSGEMVSVIKMQSPQLWEAYFNELAQDKETQLSGTPDVDLIKLKAQVLAIKEIKETFLRELTR